MYLLLALVRKRIGALAANSIMLECLAVLVSFGGMVSSKRSVFQSHTHTVPSYGDTRVKERF